jgi:hypothetical protein
MKPFADYFSDEAITDELCKFRVRLADARHQRLFYRQISSDAPAPRQDTEPDVFPPRRLWAKYRNQHRHGQAGLDVNRGALKRAIIKLRLQQPLPAWAERLNQMISTIRQRALRPDGFRFQKPEIFPKEKDKAKAEYRAIASFVVIEDKVIESLTARYLRENLDHLFTKASMAFRCARNGHAPPTHHDALDQIMNYRRRYAKAGLYVAECDIMGFYDCVDHQVAIQALEDLSKAARRKDRSATIDQRAVRIFRAYLTCYTFPQNVKAEAESALKAETGNPAAHFKWPDKALQDFHTDPFTAEVGVPQGGALSCFIANCVLHQADLRVLRDSPKVSRGQPGSRFVFRYMRYCDDMVLLSPDRSTCEIVFSVYQQALKALHLPAHPPKRIEAYDRSFWDEKSKAPYFWSKPGGKEVVPWVQFVGYQVRFDGLLRITNKAFKKHRKKLTTAADDLLKVLNPDRRAREQFFSPGIRKNARRIVVRFRAKMNAISVGRRKLGDDLGRLSSMCWASGFRGLKGKRIPLGMFRALDRHRERQIYRIIRRVRYMGPFEDNSRRVDNLRIPRYYGYPFSYVAQFATPPATRRQS